MTRTLLRAAAVLLGVWSVLCTREVHAQLLSPGDLSSVHAKIDGDEHCLECHSSGRRVDVQRCNRCHTDIGRELQTKTGLHGQHYRDKPCGECHVEHRGRKHDLVRWPDGGRDKFDHKLTGWALHGAHTKLDCAKCHNSKNERGAASYIGLSTTCKSCHEDPHEDRFGAKCQKCHDEQSWRVTDLHEFDHGLTRFPLKGRHNQVECKDCHGTPPDTKYRPLSFDSCLSCHKDPHEGRFSKNCTSCHSETGWKDLHLARSDHPKLSLSGGHAKVACKTCHDRGNDKPPSRGGSCVSCHAPIHEAPFGKDCASCHRRIAWLGVPVELSRQAHARTVFPLRGKHEAVDCDACHLPKRPLARRYKKLKYERCSDCHGDPHAGEFSARDEGNCLGCHDEHGFVPTRFGLDQHDTTTFPLVGRHQAVACMGCHEASAAHRRQEGAATAGSAGSAASVSRVSASARLDWHVTGQACVDCHDNPHGDQFATEMADGGCAHCHTPTGWDLPSVDHSIWPLTGAHEKARCEACHISSGEDAQQRSYRGVPRECEGCHDDPHAGQFRLDEPKRPCSDCHQTRSFKLPSFDHAKQAGYALEGKHQAVACTGCHRKATLHNGTTAVRYRLTYRACADCHKNPHTEEVKP